MTIYGIAHVWVTALGTLWLPTLVSILNVATCGTTLCVVLAVTLLPRHCVTLIPMSMAFTPVTPQEMHTLKITHKETLWGITMAISDWMRSQERHETKWLRLMKTFSWILVKMTNEMQLCRIIYYSLTAVHVSSNIIAHHQEHFYMNCITMHRTMNVKFFWMRSRVLVIRRMTRFLATWAPWCATQLQSARHTDS
jgi:hypothetical protein